MGGTEFHRVFLSDVFGDYIPSFNYLVVPLNKYSKQDLIEKNDELSLIFLINQLQSSSEFHDLKDIPKEYTEHLTIVPLKLQVFPSPQFFPSKTGAPAIAEAPVRI